jgi:hypothetical protein
VCQAPTTPTIDADVMIACPIFHGPDMVGLMKISTFSSHFEPLLLHLHQKRWEYATSTQPPVVHLSVCIQTRHRSPNLALEVVRSAQPYNGDLQRYFIGPMEGCSHL